MSLQFVLHIYNEIIDKSSKRDDGIEMLSLTVTMQSAAKKGPQKPDRRSEEKLTLKAMFIFLC